MSLQKWKELAEKRRLVEQYYKEKDKAIKDYKFKRGVSSDFYERVAKPVTEKIGEQIKKREEQTEKMIKQMQGLPLPGPQMHALPAPKRRSQQDTLQTQIMVLIIIGYQINIKKKY